MIRCDGDGDAIHLGRPGARRRERWRCGALELRVESQRLDALSHLAPDLLGGSGCRLSALQPAQMIDWLATLAEQRSQRFPPALAVIRHYLAGLLPLPRDYIVGQPPFP
jgi:hypothetical protein